MTRKESEQAVKEGSVAQSFWPTDRAALVGTAVIRKRDIGPKKTLCCSSFSKTSPQPRAFSKNFMQASSRGRHRDDGQPRVIVSIKATADMRYAIGKGLTHLRGIRGKQHITDPVTFNPTKDYYRLDNAEGTNNDVSTSDILQKFDDAISRTELQTIHRLERSPDGWKGAEGGKDTDAHSRNKISGRQWRGKEFTHSYQKHGKPFVNKPRHRIAYDVISTKEYQKRIILVVKYTTSLNTGNRQFLNLQGKSTDGRGPWSSYIVSFLASVMERGLGRNLKLLSLQGSCGLYDIYLAGVPGQAVSEHWIDTLPHIVPEARILQFALFGGAGTCKSTEVIPQVCDTQHQAEPARLVKPITETANGPKFQTKTVSSPPNVAQQDRSTAALSSALEDLQPAIRVLSAKSMVNESYLLLQDIETVINNTKTVGRCTEIFLCLIPLTEVKWRNILLVGFGLGSIVIKQLTPTDCIPVPASEQGGKDEARVSPQADLLAFFQLLSPSKWLIYESNALQVLDEVTDLEIYRDYLEDWDLQQLPQQMLMQVIGPSGYGKTSLLKLLAQKLMRQSFSNSTRLIILDMFLGSFGTTGPNYYYVTVSLLHQILSQRPSLFARVHDLYAEHNEEGTWTKNTLLILLYSLLSYCSAWKVALVINNFESWPTETQELFRNLSIRMASIASDYLILTSSKESIQDIQALSVMTLNLGTAKDQSSRPLRVNELAVATAIKQDCQDMSSIFDRIPMSMETDLQRHLGFFIRTDNHTVHLLSAFTRLFLTDDLPRREELEAFKLFGHADLAALCLHYLSVVIRERWELCPPHMHWKQINQLDECLGLSFLDYAVDDKLDDQVLKFLGQNDLRIKWYQLFCLGNGSSQRNRDQVTTLDIASEHGLLSIVRRLMKENNKFEASLSALEFPLDLSIRNNNHEIIQVFLDDGAKGSAAIMEAVRVGNIDVINHFLDQGRTLQAGSCGPSPLHLAAQAGCLDSAKAFKRGTMTTETDSRGRTPLHAAVIGGNVDIIELLLGCDGCVIDAKDSSNRTPLMTAARMGSVDVLQALCEKQADVAVVDNDGQTAFHFAVRADSQFAVDSPFQMTRLLLKHGADPLRPDFQSCTPLHLACQFAASEVAKNLLDSIDRNASVYRPHRLSGKNPVTLCSHTKGNVAIELAVSSGHLSTTKALYPGTIPDTVGRLLLCSSRNGFVRIVRYLLANDTPVDYCDAADKQPSLAISVFNGHKEVVGELLRHGASPNSLDSEERTTLHRAASLGHIGIAQQLVDFKADVNSLDLERWSPLHYAASKGIAGIVQLLLSHGACLNTQTVMRDTALHLAIPYREVTVEDLIRNGADHDAANINGLAPLHLAIRSKHLSTTKLIWSFQPDLTLACYTKRHPLLDAAESGSLDTVRFFLSQIPQAQNVSNERGWTPLHGAIDCGNAAAVPELIAAGAEVNQKCRSGLFPLHIVAEKGPVGIVTKLLEADAQLEIKNDAGKTPLHIACLYGQTEIVQKLLERGADVRNQDSDGQSPLHVGADRSEIAKALLDKNANINAVDDRGWTPLMQLVYWEYKDGVKFLAESGADLNIQDYKGRTALHIAVQEWNEEIVRILFESGKEKPEIDKPGISGQIALHYAAQVRVNSADLTLPRILFRYGADATKRNQDNQTSLVVASKNGCRDLVEYLLQIETGSGQRIWTLADKVDAFKASSSDPGIAKLLLADETAILDPSSDAVVVLETCLREENYDNDR
ncbi:hypothetical protein MMC11_009018, partial [Xylographa trunciseda]|nr:hypothetical protein [Xylographa trunciseda]